jgi:hypothetical protein
MRDLTPVQMLHHEARDPQFEVLEGDPHVLGNVMAHLQEHVGPVTCIMHEFLSDTVRVDLVHVGPDLERPFHTIATAGMSSRAMRVPDTGKSHRFAELVLFLPAEWPVLAMDEDSACTWPLQELTYLARLPHTHGTWLSAAHTVTNGEPPEPYAPGVGFCGAVLARPRMLPEGFGAMQTPDGRRVPFLSVIPLYDDELALVRRRGQGELLARLRANEVSEVLDPSRPSVCGFSGTA